MPLSAVPSNHCNITKKFLQKKFIRCRKNYPHNIFLKIKIPPLRHTTIKKTKTKKLGEDGERGGRRYNVPSPILGGATSWPSPLFDLTQAQATASQTQLI
jgi:hypothetical protein